jgi:hypothetical protein
MGWTLGCALLGALLGVSGCGDSKAKLSLGTEAGDRDLGGDPNTGVPVGGGGGSAGRVPNGGDEEPRDPLPPEVENTLDLSQPQASERFVYAANPEGGRVAIIDADTLAIQTLETGKEPRYLATLAGTDDAIVLNVGGDDATIIRDPALGARTVNVDVLRGANTLRVAPDGKHAVVYFDAAVGDAVSGSGSFQDISVIVLDESDDRAVDMTVGFRPRDVFFSDDSTQAFVVTEDGVSVLDFTEIDGGGSAFARTVSLGTDIDQKSLDVSVTPNGRFALAREEGASSIRLVDLRNGTIRELDLARVPEVVAIQERIANEAAALFDDDAGTPPEPAPVRVTDLDVAPDGRFALAMLRTQHAALTIPVPGGFQDEGVIETIEVEGEIVGSATIAPTSERALLYTTADARERITVFDFADGALRTLPLRKAVFAVAIAPDGETALVVHTKEDGDPNQQGIDPDERIDRSNGYSVLKLGSGDVKLQVTTAAPGSFTLVPDGSALFVAFREAQEVQKVAIASLLVRLFGLGSPPVSVGAVPQSQRVFVAQDHPDGRITFIDWVTDEAQTVTGYELNSRIQD